MNANDQQVGGSHYRSQPIQPWDFIAANGLGFFEGNIIKYVARHRVKGGIEDLRKAQHYLEKLIELLEVPEAAPQESNSSPVVLQRNLSKASSNVEGMVPPVPILWDTINDKPRA